MLTGRQVVKEHLEMKMRYRSHLYMELNLHLQTFGRKLKIWNILLIPACYLSVYVQQSHSAYVILRQQMEKFEFGRINCKNFLKSYRLYITLPDTATGVTCTAGTQKHKPFAKLHVTQVFLIFQEGNLTFPHSRVVCTCITRYFQYYVEWFQ